MLRTEDGFFADHVDDALNTLYSRVEEIENGADLSAEDEMELAALDRLIVVLESL